MITKSRLFLLGLIAFLLGVPLTERALAGVDDIIFSGIDLGLSIADVASGSS